jgi:LysM repeat protein
MIAKRSALMVLLFFLPATTFAAKRYVVKQGDNLASLAKKFRVSLITIKKANSLSNDSLNVGGTILIPDSEDGKTSVKQNTSNIREFGYSAQPVASTTEGEPKELTENQIAMNRQYVVAQNDTLSGIGNKFGVSSEDIIKQNNLKNINLRVGQRLTIPSLSESDKIPLMAAYISLANGASMSYVDDLVIGGYICKAKNEGKILSTKGLVGAKEKGSVETKVNISSAPAKYVVKKGDTLSEIARRFGVSTQEIKRANGIKNDRLKIGVSLEIPNSGGRAVARSIFSEPVKIESQKVLLYNKPREYFVENGDTLSGIGKKFEVSVKDLKNANSMRSDDLRIGARVIIPGAFLTSGETQAARENKPVSLNINETTRYVVKKGDNLILIAKRFNVSVEDLKNANHIKRGAVRIGQAISIPTQSKSVKLNVEDINTSRDQYKTDVKTSLKVGTDDNQENGDDIGDISRDSIIKVAKRFIGVPYKFGGTSLIKGLDCSAFVGKVFSFLDVDLPRTARELFGVGRSVGRNQLAAGDLVFFRTYASYPSHVGIYMGSSEFIHASPQARMVTIDSMNRPYFTKRYIGARRIEKAGLFYEELSHDYKGFER